MSMPDATLYCDKCDLSGAWMGGPLNCFYVVDGLELPMSFATGLCPDCNRIGRLREHIPDVEEIEERVKWLHDWIETYHSAWKRLVILVSPRERERINELKKEKSAYERLITFRQERLGKEICYHCGSDRVVEFTGNVLLNCESDFVYSGDVGTGFYHPDCGGEIRAKGTEMRFFYRPAEPEYFSAEGIRLESSFSRE